MFELLKTTAEIYEGNSAPILLQQASEIVNTETISESPVMQEYLDGSLTGNTDAKKLLAAALSIAVDKGYIPLPAEYSNPQAIASIADKTFDTIKIAYDIASGNISASEAADFLTKKAAAKAKTLADRVIDKGPEVAVNAIATIFPQIEIARPAILTLAKFVAPKVKEVVHQGIDILAEFAKPFVKTGIKKLQEVTAPVCNFFKTVGKTVGKLTVS